MGSGPALTSSRVCAQVFSPHLSVDVTHHPQKGDGTVGRAAQHLDALQQLLQRWMLLRFTGRDVVVETTESLKKQNTSGSTKTSQVRLRLLGLTWLRYDGSAMSSSAVFCSFFMMGWKGEAVALDRLCRAPKDDLRTSRTGEERQQSNDGKTKRPRTRERKTERKGD